ncbi:hypothetical protein [Sulfuricurvum sp. UBA5598]|uniref:hypothetical protein n=1 Tax=Sulfuricurvum sp. UBA5598 TaxID=1947586 RepID=UPI0025E170F8|nr:hypothetical protein [Sulfuricurvum sp. UBA5598]
MKTFGLVFVTTLFFVSGPAFAGEWHSAIKSTQEEAMQAATEHAKKRAKNKGTCYKPAWTKQVVKSKPCGKVDGGVRCWATSANHYGSCKNGKEGWLSAGNPNDGWSIPPIPIYPELPSIPGINTAKP